jgi:hypothetical protein
MVQRHNGATAQRQEELIRFVVILFVVYYVLLFRYALAPLRL